MKVTRVQILTRGLTLCCPNCGGHTLFGAGGYFQMNEVCPACGFKLQGAGDEGFYLRSASLNFGVTVTGLLFPVLLLAFYRRIDVLTAEVLAVAGALLGPVLLYRASRSWGLMNYYVFVPGELPANGGGPPGR
jgi:uncharacterized protein (DUF983 family)